MKKIPTIFKRNPDNMRALLNEPHPDCEWVFNGDGIATRKYDGTCCLVKDGELFKRREVKKGGLLPTDFIIADSDFITGKITGWMPVTKEDKWHLEALKKHLKINGETPVSLEDGTYELLGHKIQGNPENIDGHLLTPHSAAERYSDVPTGFLQVAVWLKGKEIEGIVWHHPDGRMAKIKKKDFGLRR